MHKKRQTDIDVVRHFKRPAEVDQKPAVPSSTNKAPNRPQSSTAGNPSKRHRERLNTELDAVAALLPFDSGIIARLDKLSVLRLAVSYLEAKTFFQVLQQRHYATWPFCTGYSSSFFNSRHFAQEQSILKALGGFIVILNENGDIIYATENIETLLGFHQSDTLHQPIFDMVHSEDREELRRMLTWNYSPHLYTTEGEEAFIAADAHNVMERHTSVRFRCFLDNTCGFMRVDVRGRLVILESCLPHCYIASRSDPNFPIFGLIAVCIPLVMPSHLDASPDEPFLRSKHTLNFSFNSADPRLVIALEIGDDARLSSHSLYTFIDPRDLSLLAEAHKQVLHHGAAGLLVYRLISRNTQRIYWFQSSCRLMMKNGKPDSISCSHRLLTEYEGAVLLSKRSSLAAKVLVLEDNMSTGSAHMNLLCGSGITQSSPGISTSLDFPLQQQRTAGGIGVLATAATALYGTKGTFRFRSSGKRTRITPSKNHPPPITAPIASQQQQQPSMTLTSTIPSYPHGRGTVHQPTGFLPYYLPPGSPHSQDAYAQSLRHYNAHQPSLINQPGNQVQPATELQLHYHLHQHYPPPYYNNAIETGQSVKQESMTNSSDQDQRMQSYSSAETANQLGEERNNALWLYSSNQAQTPSSAPDHRTKAVFSIHEVTNTLLSQ